MSKLSAGIELGVYLQGELGVYGRPKDEYLVDRDNVFKAFIEKGRHVSNYFDRFETVDELIELSNKYRRFLPALFLHSGSDVYDHLPDRKLEFLIDSLGFLITGKRKIPLEQWTVLIDDKTRYMTPAERRAQKQVYRDLHARVNSMGSDYNTYGPFATYISMWCDKPGGVRDMAYSLYFYSLIPNAAND